MAGEGITARRYAQAVFAIAKEHGTFERWNQDLDAIAALMVEAEPVFSHSRATFIEKATLVERALSNAVEPLALNLAKLLVRKNRAALAPLIARAFREMVDAERGIAHARVRTAVPLGDVEREAVARRLSEVTGQAVTVDLEIDPRIIGGLVARIGDQVIDGSTRGKLIALRRRLRQATR